MLPGPLPPPPPARAWPLRAKPQQANKSPEYLTEPLLNEVTEHLTGVEPVPPPIWGTWCGTIQGLWVGTTGAYNPTTGKAEAIALAEDGRTKLLEMSQCCVEDRVVDEHSDRIVRHTTRASNKAQLEREMAEGGAMQFDAVATHDWDTEELLFGQDGLFIFDGGSYCSGPVHLFHPLTSGTNGAAAGDTRSGGDSVSNVEEGMAAVEETVLDALESASDEEYLHLEDDLVGGLAGDDDGDEDDELYLADDGRDQLEELSLGDTSVIEACLQWNGEQRVRVQIMLSCRPLFSSGASPSELDVSLLRVSVCREGWEGMPGKYVSLEQPEGERRAQQASADERMQPKDLAGFWNEFEVAATTGELPNNFEKPPLQGLR